jgi:hypothetical protein
MNLHKVTSESISMLKEVLLIFFKNVICDILIDSDVTL